MTTTIRFQNIIDIDKPRLQQYTLAITIINNTLVHTKQTRTGERNKETGPKHLNSHKKDI